MQRLERAGSICARHAWRRCLVLAEPGPAVNRVLESLKEAHVEAKLLQLGRCTVEYDIGLESRVNIHDIYVGCRI